MRVLTHATSVAVGLLGGTLAFAPPAHALLTLSANVSGTLFTCQDQNAACDINPVVGQLALAPTTVNGVFVTGSFSGSDTAPFNVISTNSTSVINNSGVTRTMTVAVGDINFVGPVAS